MRFAPLPALVLVTIMQVLLACVLGFLAFEASVTHQRVAELYTEKARLSEKTVSVSTLRAQAEAVAASDRSLTACVFLSLVIGASGFVQLWLVKDARHALNTTIPKAHVS